MRKIVGLCLVVAVLGLGVPALAGPGVPPGVMSPMEMSPGGPPSRIGDSEFLTLPNLAPLPPYDVYVGPAEHPDGPLWSVVTGAAGPPPAKRALRFSTTIQNRGRYSFELVGAPWLPDPTHADLTTTQAYQCVRFSGPMAVGAQRECVRWHAAGTFTWHAQHRHFHIDGFGRYELRRDVGGRPDMSPAGLMGRSNKVGWCVSDMHNWREDHSHGPVGEAGDNFTDTWERNWYRECSSAALHVGASWRQGISPGWSDSYFAGFSGQEIPLRSVPDGVYWVVTTINPRDNGRGLDIREENWADNTSASRIQLYDAGRKARLLGPMPGMPYRDWFDNPEEQPGE